MTHEIVKQSHTDPISGSGDPEEKVQVGEVVLTGGGANYTVESTIDSVVSLLNSTPAVTERLTASGSGATVLQALPSTPLSGGVARASVVTAAALVALFQSVSSVAEAMTAAVMGDPTAIVQPAELFLFGGQDPASVSTVDEVVGLLNGTPEVAELIQTTGSGETVVTAGTGSLSGGGEQVSPTGTRTYGWDVHGRLAQVSLPNGQVHSYSYDYRTRRIGLQQTAVGAEPAKSTAVVFSGGLSLAEYESQTTPTTIASPSQSTVRYVRGPDMGGGVGGLLYSRRAQAVKFNLSNGRGDIVAQSDTSGALTWTASYEAYGKRTKETGENLDKQRGNSKDEDPTGLLNEGFRYRDLETGVWLSRDPAGFVDGPNVYAYVQQNPWTKFDPLGLTGSSAFGNWVCTLTPAGRQEVADLSGKLLLGGVLVTGGVMAAPAVPGLVTQAMTPVGIAAGTDLTITSLEVLAGIEGPGPVVTPGDAIKMPLQKIGKEMVNDVGGKTAQTIVKQTGDMVDRLFHRLGDTTDTIEKIEESGELWGKAPRNVFQSDIPKAKAYEGPLPEGEKGFEFKTTVPADEGHVPGKPTWSGPRPGVKVEDGTAKIPVTVTRKNTEDSQ